MSEQKKQEEEHLNVNSISHYFTYETFNIFYTESRTKSTLIITDKEPARTGSITFPETT